MKKKLVFVLLIGLLLMSCSLTGLSNKETQQPTQLSQQVTKQNIPQSTGPALITGEFTYSNDIIEIYYIEQAVALLDMTGFILRDEEWELPVDSQVLGFLDLDMDNNTGTYELSLPVFPIGVNNDVDHDGKSEEGVQVYVVAYSPNLTGGPFSEGDDKSRGWPSYLTSVVTDSENNDEVTGGKLVVWAPDDQQNFPSDFGEDGLLFTNDDPTVTLEAGYSIIDLDSSPFGIIRDSEISMTLFEPTDVAIKDFSTLSYTEAFDKMFEIVRKEYAFNGVEGKQPDWDVLYSKVAPVVEQAEKSQDATTYYLAIEEFVSAFHDGHVGFDGGDIGNAAFYQRAAGGIGAGIRELDDGRVLVVFVLDGSPAALEGIQVGDEIIGVNDTPVATVIEAVNPLFGPYSTDFAYRYDQVLFLLRGSIGDPISVTYKNKAGAEKTVSFTRVQEYDSLLATYIYGSDEVHVLPVESRIINGSVGYVSINSNYDDLNLIIRLFERALKVFEENNVAGIIIDMRKNSGGAPLGLAGFLYDQEIPMGQLEYYSEKTGKFEPEGTREKVIPNENQYSFDKMVLLVGNACFSACEIESYGFSKVPGMVVMGQYPTGGVEAEVARGQFKLPEGFSLQIPTGRFTLEDGSIFLEGVGVVPDVRIPIDEASVLSTQDTVLQDAISSILGE
ncbi:MAG: S41 family peptidase [Anaerolineaceae bacterium]